MAQAPVKTFRSVEDVYPTTSACARESTRWKRVVDHFEMTFGERPSYIIRAPGRVNVIGEHVDYSLFPVIPAAIEQDILIAISFTPSSSSSPRIQITNTSQKYKSQDFGLVAENGGWAVEGGLGKDWASYAKACISECSSKTEQAPASMKWLVDGVVPEGAGLSSSAAFVVASVLAVSVANGVVDTLNQTDVVNLALRSEHRLGLVTGGMDQAASVFCTPGQLLHLSFHPEMSPALLPLPSSLALIITNSLAPHALADSAPERYNLRVFENLCAVRLLLHSWNVEVKCPHPKSKEQAGRVWMKEAMELLQDNLGLDEEQCFKRVLSDLDKVLGADGRDEAGWTIEQIVAASGMTQDEFDETFTKFIRVRADRFHLYKRAKHTIEESLRVIAFKALCDQSGSTTNGALESSSKRLGDLINESHRSMKEDYDATVPSVDTLQELCLETGALGARQTGGGWGGAVISLVNTEDVPRFLKEIRGKYEAYKGLDEEALDKAVFATAPGCGAGVFMMRDDSCL